jgi:hypothetical protein
VSAARAASRAGEPTAPPHTGGRPSTSDSKLSTRPGDPVVALDDDDPTLADIEPVVTPVERRRAVNG